MCVASANDTNYNTKKREFVCDVREGERERGREEERRDPLLRLVLPFFFCLS
jgi:hypothetical protein